MPCDQARKEIFLQGGGSNIPERAVYTKLWEKMKSVFLMHSDRTFFSYPSPKRGVMPDVAKMWLNFIYSGGKG